MTLIAQNDLKGASQTYAVANTPLFLIAKLRADASVQRIAKSHSGEDILKQLHQAVSKTPSTLIDYVFPYVCIVALSMKESDIYLRGVAESADIQRWEWLDYIRRVLLQTYLPTSDSVVTAPKKINVTPLISSNAPVKTEVVKMS
jgi:hypothetical protein